MESPNFVSSSPQRPGELEPYSCPLVYCPPSQVPGLGKVGGNYTFSICVKYLDNINPDNRNYIKKTCTTSYSLCSDNCENIKNGDFRYHIDDISYNYTRYAAGACEQGDLTTIRNKSSIFPLSSQKVLEIAPNPPMLGISTQNQTNLMLPLILVLILIHTFVHKRH